MGDESHVNSRRNFLKSGLIAISTAALPSAASASSTGASGQSEPAGPALHFHEDEKLFLEAAVDRLIPPDERWTGAVGAGVVNYIDLQMAGDWGKGKLICMQGPFRKGLPTQGYQLEYTPAELFRRSIGAINKIFQEQGSSFSALPPAEKDEFLSKIEKGDLDLDGVPSNVFFDFLWKHTQEGFFADPIYGGNKNKVSWRMLGFPGAYTDFYDLVDQHGMALTREPIGIGDGAMHMQMNPTARLRKE